MEVTRLAPSPTGALHLGNARTFMATWALARQRGWKIVLRIEDLDGPRIKANASQDTIDDLKWLEIDWDEGPTYQLPRMARYRELIDKLIASGHVYPCVCTRKEIEQAASAPHSEDGATIYPGTCRGRFKDAADALAQTGRTPAWRFAMPDMTFEFRDSFVGVKRYDLSTQIGDFVVAKPDFTPSYQLAVVVDDHDAGVTQVVRGDDLLDSVPRQAMLYHALGWDDALPSYWHLPLVLGPDGRRLAKRHGDTTIRTYRQTCRHSRWIRLQQYCWCGISPSSQITAEEFLQRFDINNLPRDPIRLIDD